MQWALEQNVVQTFRGLDPRKTLIGLDFDGTLTPIVKEFTKSVLSPTCAVSLPKIIKKYPTVIISGRHLGGLKPLLKDLKVQCVGCHGWEFEEAIENPLLGKKFPEGLFEMLEESQKSFPDIFVEKKTDFSLTVHGSTEHLKDLKQKLRARYSEKDLAFIGGHRVLNLIPGDPVWNKSHALTYIMRHYKLNHAIYIGDDVTDEYVFALPPEKVFGIIVAQDEQKKKNSKARYYLKDPEEVGEFLNTLVS